VRTPGSCRSSFTLPAIATVGGDGPGTPLGAGDDPLDGRSELRGVGRIVLLHSVVHDGPVVVDDLRSVSGGWRKWPQPGPAAILGQLFSTSTVVPANGQ